MTFASRPTSDLLALGDRLLGAETCGGRTVIVGSGSTDELSLGPRRWLLTALPERRA
jgi:hypothetical protein